VEVRAGNQRGNSSASISVSCCGQVEGYGSGVGAREAESSCGGAEKRVIVVAKASVVDAAAATIDSTIFVAVVLAVVVEQVGESGDVDDIGLQSSIVRQRDLLASGQKRARGTGVKRSGRSSILGGGGRSRGE